MRFNHLSAYGKNRQFADPGQAYQQVDIRSGQIIALFPKWAIAEVNWQESSFHDRGVPYLVSARKTLEAVGAMINGLVQKWIRAGGEIEMYSLKDAARWEDVEDFRDVNEEGLNPETDNLIRQIFAKGDIDVKRIHGDKMDGDARAIELLLEIIFMAAGIPKEVMGFKGHLVVRNMASLSAQSYYSILHNVKKKIDRVLKRAIDLQILLMFSEYRKLPEEVPYTISGLDFLKDGVDFRINRAQKIVNLVLGVAQLYENPTEVLTKLNHVFQKEMSDFNLQFSDNGLRSSLGEVKPVRSPGSQETKEEAQ